MRTRLSRLLILFAVVALLLGLDRGTKWAATEHLFGAAPRVFLGGAVRLEYAETRGAFLGLGDQLPELWRFWILTVATGLVLLVIAWTLVGGARPSGLRFASLGLILAGGAGNLVDRAAEGYVVDFVSLGLGGVRTGIFNVADVAITAGALLLLLEWFAELRSGEPAA